ncbi:hypothetical protein ACZ87_02396 [Candidatus Erwinia dacicola]|uniref:Uncharacterized protein n=1 Tax=Candidatus Erwinia dacicola TaxID=252393 RepID=A0A328TJJ7_9GAMM|nr:hypothetical protein ACZ87_02396 [Candidatus Erwinia dacicola]
MARIFIFAKYRAMQAKGSAIAGRRCASKIRMWFAPFAASSDR